MPKTDNDSSQQAPFESFVSLINDSLQQQTWDKLLLSKYRGKEQDLQRLTIRSINLRDETALSFVYSYKTRDITKNLNPADGVAEIKKLLS
ncbi:MAG: hypothetical protein ACJA0N_001220, partial [Pseudohongiellaceae bacterium]